MTTWIILRAAGIGAYLLLFLSIALGLVSTTAPFGKRFAKASAVTAHQLMSTVALVLLAVHIGGLVLDTYMPFGPGQILVPFTSSYRTVPVATGVIAMYGMLLVLVSSWLRKRYPVRVWRAIHLMSVPTFVLAMFHGITAGADATRPWMYEMYVATGAILVFLLVLRGLVAWMKPERRTQSSPRSAPPSPGRPEEVTGEGTLVASTDGAVVASADTVGATAALDGAAALVGAEPLV